MPKLIALAKVCAIGDPWDEATSFGPLISSVQRNKVLDYIKSGIEEGATVATGGKVWGEKGFYVEPTILTDCHANMKCVREEVSLLYNPFLLSTIRRAGYLFFSSSIFLDFRSSLSC